VFSVKDQDFMKELEQDLVDKYGHTLSGDDLQRTLGFPTLSALRQAINRKQIPIPIFTIKHRKGKFALAKDVANWLAYQRESANVNVR